MPPPTRFDNGTASSEEPASDYHCHCEEPIGDVAISCICTANWNIPAGDSHGLMASE